jgi:hypothetical protein
MATFLDLFNQDSTAFNVAGGFDIAQLNLAAQQAAMEAEAGRREFGRSLLQDVIGMRQNPFDLTTAMMAAGAGGVGGGISPFTASLQRSGGVGQPAPPMFGDVATNLLRQLSIYAGGAGINPQTGLPYTPKEIAYLNIVQQQQAPQPRASVV